VAEEVDASDVVVAAAAAEQEEAAGVADEVGVVDSMQFEEGARKGAGQEMDKGYYYSSA